ncbi:hypothetical protein CPC08DRAFT_613252, partial [Agrocybe pediades]
TRPVDLAMWHRRFGHPAEETLLRMANRKVAMDGLVITKKVVTGRCEDCIFGKQSRRPFDAVVPPSPHPLARVGTDL